MKMRGRTTQIFWSLLLGFCLLGTPALAKYECITGTGEILKRWDIGDRLHRTWEDYDGDGEPDAEVTYILDHGCYREIRRRFLPSEETLKETFERDILAIQKYLEYIKNNPQI